MICGPSGAGKGTLISIVAPLYADVFVSVSATTRSRRAGEREGRDYLFMPREEFLRRVEGGYFLEWAEYGCDLYGTPADPVWANLGSARDVILEIELDGARQVKRRVPDAWLVFIAPPGLDELEERLRRRRTETEASIRRRMEKAREEMDALARDAARDARHEAREFDYVIVNGDVEAAADELRHAIDEIRAHDPTR